MATFNIKWIINETNKRYRYKMIIIMHRVVSKYISPNTTLTRRRGWGWSVNLHFKTLSNNIYINQRIVFYHLSPILNEFKQNMNLMPYTRRRRCNDKNIINHYWRNDWRKPTNQRNIANKRTDKGDRSNEW